MFPNEVLGLLLSFCDHLTRLRFSISSRDVREYERSSEGREEALLSFCTGVLSRSGAPPGLVKALDVTQALRRMERRNLEGSGPTGYLDWLTPRDFGKKPILYGQDPVGRFYVAICFIWRSRVHVTCLFQRYSDDQELFVNTHDVLYGGVLTSHFDHKCPRLNDHHVKLLTLVSNGSVTLASGEEVVLASTVDAYLSRVSRAHR